MRDTINQQEYQQRLRQLAKKMGGGKNAAIFLETLAKNKQFYNALESSVGQELLKECVKAVQDRISKIMNEEDTPDIRAELRAYMNILNRWSGTIEKYREYVEKLDNL